MTVEVPAELAADVAALAVAEGCTPEEYLRRLLEREIRGSAVTQKTELPSVQGNRRADRYAELRRQIVASGIPLLNDEELRDEIRTRIGLRSGTGD
jgi:hypothetical protein